MDEYLRGNQLIVYVNYLSPSVAITHISEGIYTIKNVIRDWIKLEGIKYPIHKDNLF